MTNVFHFCFWVANKMHGMSISFVSAANKWNELNEMHATFLNNTHKQFHFVHTIRMKQNQKPI